ncbi:MAG TPA: hypothetical protein VIL46_11230 [Gemmataceae bacterium]
MSRHNKQRRHRTEPPAAAPPAPAAADLGAFGRRALLGGLTALLVARLLVADADPARLRLTSGPGGVVLNLLTYGLLLLWAFWAAFTRQGVRRGGAAALALLGLVGWLAVAAARSDYSHPGWHLAWTAGGMFVLFFLTLQLADRYEARRGLTAVLVATVLTLSLSAAFHTLTGGGRLGAAPSADPADAFAHPPDTTPPPAPNPVVPLADPDVWAALLLLALPAAWFFARSAGRRAALLLPGALAAGLALALAATDWPARPYAWEAASRAAAGEPLFGVGPGQFAAAAGARLPPGAPPLTEPHSAWLGLAATAGSGAVLILLLALGLWAGKVLRAGQGGEAAGPAETGGADWPRWEFYLGGMAGLLLGFALGMTAYPWYEWSSVLLTAAGLAVIRVLVWFPAVALLELVAPLDRAVAKALLAGVLAAAAWGAVSDGPAAPQAAAALAVALGLGLGAAAPAARRPAGPTAGRLTAAGALALLSFYWLQAAAPALASASAVREARAVHRVAGAEDPRGALTYAHRTLYEAWEEDPGNAALLRELAWWRLRQWEWLFAAGSEQQLAEAGAVARDIRDMLAAARSLEPRNAANPLAFFEVCLTLTEKSAAARSARLAVAGKMLDEVAARLPRRAPELRARLAKAEAAARKAAEEAKKAAEKAAAEKKKGGK